MKPRDFIDFFKTPSGKLLIFAAALGGGLALLGWLRGRTEVATIALVTGTNKTDQPQLIQTVNRPMEVFRPPTAKLETPAAPPPSPRPANGDIKPLPKEGADKVLPPISLVADTTARKPEPQTLSPVYAPYGRLISCETVITVDSSSIQTPIVGLITEDVYHAGQLVIPAGTEVHGSAQTDRARERIASGTAWTLVWQTGEELGLRAIALDREFDGSRDQVGWGITDGSAGLRGQLIKSDDLAEIKLFAATFLSGAASALTEKETTLFGSIDRRSLNNAPLKGAEEILGVYAKGIYESIQRDGIYTRVPSGKQFYLYVLQTIDRGDAVLAGARAGWDTEGPATTIAQSGAQPPPDFLQQTSGPAVVSSPLGVSSLTPPTSDDAEFKPMPIP